MPSRSQTAAVYENYQPETEALESPSKQAVCKSTQYIPATIIWKRLIEKIWDTFLSYCFSVIVTSGSDTPPWKTKHDPAPYLMDSKPDNAALDKKQQIWKPRNTEEGLFPSH